MVYVWKQMPFLKFMFVHTILLRIKNKLYLVQTFPKKKNPFHHFCKITQKFELISSTVTTLSNHLHFVRY